jgi:dihydroorotase
VFLSRGRAVTEEYDMRTITLTKPDDMHIHLRDGDFLKTTVPDAAKHFQRVIVMPNLKPPISTISQAHAYRDRILAAVPESLSFQPLMTLYLTDQTIPTTIKEAKESGIIFGCKLYPQGSTYLAEAGIKKLENMYPVFAAMETFDLPLLLHGEVTDTDVDVFDRELVFIEQKLIPLVAQFPHLRIVLEHITTKQAVEYINSAHERIAATITAHHLLLNRNDLFRGGIHPHHYCLPILKRREHQQALIAAATSGDRKFFLGSDSAPHPQQYKENDCGCAGIYTAHAAIELYAEAFEAAEALPHLEAFGSFNGADFYQLPRNQTRIILQKEPWRVPLSLDYGATKLIPFRAGSLINWKLRL